MTECPKCGNSWEHHRSYGLAPVCPAEARSVPPSEPPHRQADELGHGSDGRMFHEATCPRCGLMLAYLVRDQVECAASHPAGEQRP